MNGKELFEKAEVFYNTLETGEWHQLEEGGELVGKPWFVNDTEVVEWDFENFTKEENMAIADYCNFKYKNDSVYANEPSLTYLDYSLDGFAHNEMFYNAK